MRKILNKSHTDIHSIAYILGLMSVFGYVVSFLRDRAFAHYFGVGELLDVFVASFRIPDMLFILTTAFVSIYALLPMFEEKNHQGKERLQEFINTVFYFLILFLTIGATVLFFAIPWIGSTLFNSFSPEAFETFILLSRIFIIQAVLFTIVSFFTAILQFKRKFLAYSLLPITYNLGIIVGVIFFYPTYGAVGLAVGVILGVLLNIAIQVPVILKNDMLPRLAPTQKMLKEFWRVIVLSTPRSSALLSFTITNLIIFGVVVSISEGTLSVYYFAENLKAVPVIVIGIAYSVASFPVLVRLALQNDKQGFREIVEVTLRRLLFFILPLVALVFVLREPIISLLFETGKFTTETTFITGTIVGIFIFGALTTSVLNVCARALYAFRRSFIPFIISISLSVAEITLVIFAVKYLQTHRELLIAVQEVTGLTSGGYGTLFVIVGILVVLETIAATTMLIVLARIINQNLSPVVKSLIQNIVAAFVLASSVVLIKTYVFSTLQYNSIQGFLAIVCMSIIGVLFWYIALRLMKNQESDIVKNVILTVRQKVWKR